MFIQLYNTYQPVNFGSFDEKCCSDFERNVFLCLKVIRMSWSMFLIDGLGLTFTIAIFLINSTSNPPFASWSLLLYNTLWTHTKIGGSSRLCPPPPLSLGAYYLGLIKSPLQCFYALNYNLGSFPFVPPPFVGGGRIDPLFSPLHVQAISVIGRGAETVWFLNSAH